MKNRKTEAIYQPISCNLHSQYELAIMHKNKLDLTWIDDGKYISDTNIMPVDIKTKNKAEYLIAKTSAQKDLILRLDQITKMQVLKNKAD